METISRQEPRLTIDINAQRNFVEFHSKLGPKPETTIRFFDRTDCYTVHGDDCQTIAKIVYKSTRFIHHLLKDEANSLSYVTLSKINFELAVRELLLVRNLRVEVYQKRANGGDWHVQFRGSPGNLIQFEDILFSNKEVLVNNMMLSLQMRKENNGISGTIQRKIGIASVEQNDCLFQLLEFIDDDFFTELEATIVLLSPKECLLPSMEDEYATVKNVLERNGIMVTIPKKVPPAERNDIVQDLNRLIRFSKGQHADASALPELQLLIAKEALRDAIKYLDLMVDAGNLGHYKIKQLNLSRFVHLDGAAVTALNILPNSGTMSSTRSWQSVLGVLDHCRTPQGHRLMMQWVKQPLRSRELLNDRHNIVQCLLESPDTLDILHDDYLKRIPDILMLTKKLMRRKATLQDLFRIYQVLLRTPKIYNTLLSLENSTVHSVLCNSFKSHLEDLTGLKQMVEQVIDFESIDSGEYLVKASFDEQLKKLKDRMSALFDKMERLKTKANCDLNLERSQQVRLENVSHLGYHFRITLKDDSVLRKNKKYTIVDVVKGGVRFTTDQLKGLSEEYQELCTQYEEQQKSIVEEIIQVAIGYSAPLTSLNSELAQLDCLVSFAKAAQSAPIPYVRPTILEEGSGVLELRDLRHPCLELQEHVTYISNDVDFKRDVCNMLIITGPNMGGKSTYIRSVGTAVLMAHVGSFVPCSQAVISIVDCILGRVGASDNIIKGLSTFMVEMIETSGIIRTATERSLVIIDELGRGTSTYEGCGVAWSIAEHLGKETRCFTLFATHFHEITQLADAVPTVKNCHMAAVADNNDFTLLYQVRPGAMEKSFGIQVARLANFPPQVIQDAQNFYKEFDDQHVEKQSADDKIMLAAVNKAIADLSREGNDASVTEEDLCALVERFKCQIEKLDGSAYFKAVLTDNTNNTWD